ncbi:hypothetical protein T265_02863 [Opisthorchis viverrini]|uniref:Uncharacterized protein n=1 Tax=Opisthorchis viverrini TaxID=6198 RepID=A0A074ZXX4_OPIVI|nr:hypothetical protein T265_02863 [Opisthorchis viverrini]KER30827.1 hypothetical protein T265_02863 [Opisthorchis viverrini]
MDEMTAAEIKESLTRGRTDAVHHLKTVHLNENHRICKQNGYPVRVGDDGYDEIQTRKELTA